MKCGAYGIASHASDSSLGSFNCRVVRRFDGREIREAKNSILYEGINNK